MDSRMSIIYTPYAAAMASNKALAFGVGASAVFMLYWVTSIIYLRYLHPLRKFPGPFWASVSGEWLYRILSGQFPEQDLATLHKQYETQGLRIAPNELHVTDISLYHVVYSQTSPYLKYKPFYDGFLTPHTAFAEDDPSLHKERRRMLNPFFSRSGVFRLEPIIIEKARILSTKIRRLCNMNDIDVYDAFRAFTTEFILEFAFGRPGGLIEEQPETFRSWFLDGLDRAGDSFPIMVGRPWLREIFQRIPMKLVGRLVPELSNFFSILEFAEQSMRFWQQGSTQPGHPVIFDSLTDLKDEERVAEAVVILIAGADTTASSLTTAIKHILKSPKIQSQLTKALDSSFPDDREFIPLRELETCEYLNACVKEALRIGMAVPGRLPRVVSREGHPLLVEGKVVPPGTVVSISAYTMHTSVEAWGPDALEFKPERWLGPESKKLDHYLVTFSKGTQLHRLAPAEMTLVLGWLFRNFKMQFSPHFGEPKLVDRFTLHYGKQGVLIRFEPRRGD
ncbi:Trichodiene oxygenase [Penicillium rolfsii]|nr:Trichodiene oxygenase [Penicillium rolfsii]